MSETHTHTHDGRKGDAPDEAGWNARYAEKDRIWSGNPNALLIREASDLVPGRALDLGCGEGADAIWLARRGWNVVGADISSVALDRAAEYATREGVADRIDFQRHVLGETFPDGEFDLISAMFLHSWGEFRRDEILRRAAAAIAPGGTLLVVGHHADPVWMPEGQRHLDVHFPTPQEVLAGLRLAAGEWEVVRAEEFASPVIRPDGEPDTRPDNVVNVRRLPSTHVRQH